VVYVIRQVNATRLDLMFWSFSLVLTNSFANDDSPRLDHKSEVVRCRHHPERSTPYPVRLKKAHKGG
jgi:hypothetical protein